MDNAEIEKYLVLLVTDNIDKERLRILYNAMRWRFKKKVRAHAPELLDGDFFGSDDGLDDHVHTLFYKFSALYLSKAGPNIPDIQKQAHIFVDRDLNSIMKNMIIDEKRRHSPERAHFTRRVEDTLKKSDAYVRVGDSYILKSASGTPATIGRVIEKAMLSKMGVRAAQEDWSRKKLRNTGFFRRMIEGIFKISLDLQAEGLLDGPLLLSSSTITGLLSKLIFVSSRFSSVPISQTDSQHFEDKASENQGEVVEPDTRAKYDFLSIDLIESDIDRSISGGKLDGSEILVLASHYNPTNDRIKEMSIQEIADITGIKNPYFRIPNILRNIQISLPDDPASDHPGLDTKLPEHPLREVIMIILCKKCYEHLKKGGDPRFR